jgi:hypothetical protein
MKRSIEEPVPQEVPLRHLLEEDEEESHPFLGLSRPSLPQPLMGNSSALIHGKWKLINGWHGVYDGYWSNTPYMHTEADFFTQLPVKVNEELTSLFDLSLDPEERHNVAADNIDVVLRMQARLVELADPANGYMRPQNNKPSRRALPSKHNGTWSPWKPSKSKMILV